MQSAIRQFSKLLITIQIVASDCIGFAYGLLRSRTALVSENLFLRKQLALFQERKERARQTTPADRFIFAKLVRLFDWLGALVIVKPDTLISRHRTAFRRFWRWKSRPSGRPKLPVDIRIVIRRMAAENPTWGEERIADELLLSALDPAMRFGDMILGADPRNHRRRLKMRNMLQKLILGIAITVAGAFAADNSLGTWKLNMDKSKFSPTAPVKSLTYTREASDDGVKVISTGERADGTRINGSYTAKYDGKEYPVTGAPYDSIAIKQVNANTFTTTQKNSGTKYSTTARAVISKDAKTMTVTVQGTGTDGERVRYTMVYDKQ